VFRILVAKIDFYPDLIIRVQNGGTFVLNEFKDAEKFDYAHFEMVKIQRKDNFKNKMFFKYIPLKITDRLRVYENDEIKDGLKIYPRSNYQSRK
jgi:uncharacterized protein